MVFEADVKSTHSENQFSPPYTPHPSFEHALGLVGTPVDAKVDLSDSSMPKDVGILL